MILSVIKLVVISILQVGSRVQQGSYSRRCWFFFSIANASGKMPTRLVEAMVVVYGFTYF